MARLLHLFLLLLAASHAPCGAWGRPLDRFLQQGGPSASAAAPAYEAQPQPFYSTMAGAGGAPAAKPQLVSPEFGSPFRFADVGSATAGDVAGAIDRGDPAVFAAAAASAGPEAAGRAVSDAVLGGQGPALAGLVNASNDPAAADAFLTVSKASPCINNLPPRAPWSS